MAGNDFFENMMEFCVLGTFAMLVALLFYFLFVYRNHTPGERENDAIKRAGNRGEAIATDRLKSVLRAGDRLYTNVCLEFEGQRTELDNVIVNENGVFIVEVKNYSGLLVGTEDMPTWTKIHKSAGGETYTKTVKNPIGQVKRQTYILAKLLRSQNIRSWVDGYAYLVEENSPVKSAHILSDTIDMRVTFHRAGKRHVTPADMRKIDMLFSGHLAAAA